MIGLAPHAVIPPEITPNAGAIKVKGRAKSMYSFNFCKTLDGGTGEMIDSDIFLFYHGVTETMESKKRMILFSVVSVTLWFNKISC